MWWKWLLECRMTSYANNWMCGHAWWINGLVFTSKYQTARFWTKVDTRTLFSFELSCAIRSCDLNCTPRIIYALYIVYLSTLVCYNLLERNHMPCLLIVWSLGCTQRSSFWRLTSMMNLFVKLPHHDINTPCTPTCYRSITRCITLACLVTLMRLVDYCSLEE